MTKKELALEEASTAVNSQLPNHRSLYVNLVGLRKICQDKEVVYKCAMTNHPAPMPLHIGNCMSHTFNETRVSHEFLNLRSALTYLESLPEAQEAFAILQPLVDRVAELEEEVQAERRAASEASNRLLEAVEMARAAAEEKLEKDPAVIAARKALEAAQPALVAERLPDPPLVRGKIATRPLLEIEQLAAE